MDVDGCVVGGSRCLFLVFGKYAGVDLAGFEVAMIVSRMMAKRRIKAGEKPSALAAWVLVFIDVLAVAAVAWIIWVPLYTWLDGAEYSILFTAGILFCILFIPTQFLLILSALWAVKSRWIGEDEPG